MKMKRIANNVALQTIGYVISGFTNVYIYVRECGYQKRDIYRGLYKHFAHDEMNKYAMQIANSNYADIIQCGDAFQVREEGWEVEQ